MVSGALDPSDSNMTAPLLARRFSELLFADVSAFAFTTVLGTVSEWSVAAGGCVAHDFVGGMLGWKRSDQELIRVAKVSSVAIGAIAVLSGLALEGMNVSYLVGWVFAIAASANLPVLLILLFWPRTIKQGIIAGVLVGILSSALWIAVCPAMFKTLYGLDPKQAWVPFSQPGLVPSHVASSSSWRCTNDSPRPIRTIQKPNQRFMIAALTRNLDGELMFLAT
jgi:cation/acetate symporter